ncbi:hypothetical protein [Streptomyces sp. NBC_00989]|uniref:hypothetical protein n=1 Tax=Streptomyces sp. NBC_00989 TaxID=2903705 RepID=UPI00386E5F21|nr:hypothetical protein OG714_53105 [Streptomyces sp. NBC_00989]
MTVFPITTGLLLIVMVSTVVGVSVFLYTKKNSTAAPPTGDLGTAIGSAVAIAMFLVTVGLASAPSGSTDPPAGGAVPTCSSTSHSRGC